MLFCFDDFCQTGFLNANTWTNERQSYSKD